MNELQDQRWNLRPFWDKILEIFSVYVKLCERHNLKYYAWGGTALGAVRHRGFIPWDDDFDVAMPRKDYNEFIKYAKNELPKGMRLVRGGEERNSLIYFSKIILDDMGLLQKLSEQTGLKLTVPIYIDIFVLDGVPDDLRNFGEWWRFRRIMRLCQLYRYPASGNASKTSVVRRIKLLLARIVGFLVSLRFPETKSNEEMMDLMDKLCMEKWPYEQGMYLAEQAFFKMKTSRLIPRMSLEPARVVPFENTVIRVPFGVDGILTSYYGDYMKLPPPEYRIPEHTLKNAYNHV